MKRELIDNMEYEHIKDEAAKWFARLNDPKCPADEKEKFQHWLRDDPLHPIAYELCESVWHISADLADDPSIQKEVELARQSLRNTNKDQSRPRYSVTGLRFFQYAAVFMLVAILVIANTNTADVYNTDIGEQRLITLADGSTAMLNTDTVLKTLITDKKRELRLMKGEAYFDVAHDKERPFKVLAGGNIVRALGTEFNVALEEQEITVAVTEGQVAIETYKPLEGNQLVAKIKPGEEISYHKNGPKPEIKIADLERISAWQTHKIYFKSDRLEDAIKEYNRYIKSNIQIVDEELKNQLITGIFNVGDLESFLFTLEQALDARVIKERNRILVLKKQQWAQQQEG